MRMLTLYFRERKRVLFALFLFAGIFLLSFRLYHLPARAVLYPVLLCAGFGVLFGIGDYCRVYGRHKRLQMAQEQMEAQQKQLGKSELWGAWNDWEDLPILQGSGGILEKDYENVIAMLCSGQRMWESHMRDKYADMVDYYTVWVHQIKTPISAMKLHLQNEDSHLSRKLSLDLFRIEQYVEMVLMFLRLDSESTDYVIRKYDLDGIVKQAVKKFSGEFIEKKLRLEYEPLDTEVLTDEKWLSFVIGQVLSNALKYTKEGAVSIYLKGEKTLCIKDTGIGIAPEDLPRIFERGYTGCNGRRDKMATGIGLYLCKRICHNLRHEIWAESVVGRGTVICLDLSREKLEIE